jgi:hypothetical protein
MEGAQENGGEDMSGVGYVQHNAGRNYFVDKLLPPTCGGCGKPLRRNGNSNVGYLCRKCGPRPRPSYNETNCSTCKFLADCTARLGAGAWVRCEIPDEGDLRRLLGDKNFSNEAVRSTLEAALDGHADRVPLETAVSRAANIVYQKRIERFTRSSE